MFKMRAEQFEELERAWQADFHQYLAGIYREHLPVVTAPLDDATLLQRVVAADKKARAHGIETKRGIAQYVGIALVNGPDFDEHPEIQRYFQMPGATPDEKMQYLTDRCAELEQKRQKG
jgi:hypothetical protein